jgi:DNA invertase Pin-like site-specific DNA recombinase
MNTTTAQTSGPRQVGIWIRVSTEDQAQGDSPEHHLQRAREYARFNGWEVREVYDLAGVSGKTVMEHPEAKRMLADIKRRHISALIFSKLARLARNTKELLDFSDKFAAYGADMVSLHEKIDTSSPAGRLFYTIIAAMAQWEREEIGDRVRASIGVRARMGKPLNGSAPYGFHWVEKKLTTHPKESLIVKQVFELFLDLKRKGAVARKLNEAGYRTRESAMWRDSQVARVLREPAAAGTYVYNTTRRVGEWKYEAKPEDQWSKLTVPAIISHELWHQVSLILGQQEKTIARPGRVPVRLFGGLTVCECGKRMYVPSGSRKYTCTKCKTKILSDDLEEIFYGEVENSSRHRSNSPRSSRAPNAGPTTRRPGCQSPAGDSEGSGRHGPDPPALPEQPDPDGGVRELPPALGRSTPPATGRTRPPGGGVGPHQDQRRFRRSGPPRSPAIFTRAGPRCRPEEKRRESSNLSLNASRSRRTKST